MFIHPKRTNPRLVYNLRCLAREITPNLFFRRKLQKHLDNISESLTPEQSLRLDYYCKLSVDDILPESAASIGNIAKGKSTYYCDLSAFTRYFDPDLKLHSVFKDIRSYDQLPPYPAIAKSRPTKGDNHQVVLFKLDQIRHNFLVHDALTFKEKADVAIWRGMGHTEQRNAASRLYAANKRVDIGIVRENEKGFVKPRVSIADQLRNKFVISLQGNDLATNLHWAMGSNSLCVMPKPKNEGWSMESWLKPDEHYVEVADDMSDIEEKMDHYLAHPDLAEYVIQNANRYVAQFYDETSEFALKLMVLYRYFQRTGQMV